MAACELLGVGHAYRRGRPVLSGVNLVLERGVTGLLGVNGAGKSTLMRALAGAMRPTHGVVTVGGADLYGRGRQVALSQVAWMPQVGSAPKGMTAVDFVTYFTWLRGIPRREARSRAREALATVRLEDVAERKLGALSGGMMRRAWLAQALAAHAEVIILDEPSTGLDPRQRDRMVAILAGLPEATILLSSHLLEDVSDLAQRVVVLDEGRVVHDGSTPQGADAQVLLDLMPDREAVS